jgi:hypothetical protein
VHPQQAHETSTEKALLAAGKLFNIVQKYNADQPGPNMVGRTLDALLLSKSGIAWLCRNVDVDDLPEKVRTLQ